MRRPLRTIQPVNMPQPPPHLLLLQLLLCQALLLLSRLKLHISAILRLAIDRTARHARRCTTHSAAARAAILKAVRRHGQMALVRHSPVRNMPLFGAQRADELLVVADHHHPAAVVANGDGQAAERVAVQVVGRLVEDE